VAPERSLFYTKFGSEYQSKRLQKNVATAGAPHALPRPFEFPLLTERSWRILVSVTDRRSPKLSKPSDLVQGTLDMLLLKILALEPMNGYAISQRLKQVSSDVLQVSDGSLYPALHKLEQQGWIKAEWKSTDNNRRAKFYSLTRPGRRQLEKEAENWSRLSAAISQVVKLETSS
jgi:PadR family transcriptional regulator, regulatory protein PadR